MPEDAERQRILDAALIELTTRNIGAFTLERVAERVGRNALEVKRFWANTPELYTATLMAWGERHMPVPDTGTLRGDLLEFSRSYAAAVNSPMGQRVLDAVIISPKDWDMSGSREAFREARPNRLTVMIHRAIERGECDADIDPILVTDLLSSGLCTPVLFYGAPITDEYAEQVVTTILRGVLRR